jgi:thiol:disulfide interchange protein
LSVFLCCCDGNSSRSDAEENGSLKTSTKIGDLPESWVLLESSLSDYVKSNPGRPIIVSFGALWSDRSQFSWRILCDHEVSSLLSEANFLCLAGDITNHDELTEKEMRGLGVSALPVTTIFNPKTGEWRTVTELFSARDVSEWMREM